MSYFCIGSSFTNSPQELAPGGKNIMDESGETEGPALAAVASQRSSGGTNFSIASYQNP